MKIEVFFQNYDLLREVIAGMFEHMGKNRWKRVDLVLLMIRMSVYYQAQGKGRPFASARWYAANCFCSEKTVDRAVKWLREHNLLRTKRLRRRDTEIAWVTRNSRGFTNEDWRELSQMNGGAAGPFKVYPPGFLSTNEMDLDLLLAWLRKLIGKALTLKVAGFRVYRSQDGITFKAWFPVDPYLEKPPPWPVESFLALP